MSVWGKEKLPIQWNARDEHGRHWNGQRWVTHREWTIALRIRALADWGMLPWYKRIFVRKPK
mgnify:CR=1 FL=1